MGSVNNTIRFQITCSLDVHIHVAWLNLLNDRQGTLASR